MSNLPVPGQAKVLDHQTTRALVQTARIAVVQRAADRARADLAIGRVSDIRRVTRHAIAEGLDIALDVEPAAGMAPWATQDFMRIARSGFGAMDGTIRGLQDAWL